MFPRLRSLLTTLPQRKRFEDSLDEEVRFHLDAQTEDLVRTGAPPEEAARRARVLFGSIEAMKDDCRRARDLRIARPWKQLYLRGKSTDRGLSDPTPSLAPSNPWRRAVHQRLAGRGWSAGRSILLVRGARRQGVPRGCPTVAQRGRVAAMTTIIDEGKDQITVSPAAGEDIEIRIGLAK